MKQVRLSTLISGIDYRLKSGSPDIEISGLSCDSRSVKKGYLFIAVSGNDHDGHNFIKQAVKKGASSVILERDVEIKQDVVKIIVPNTRSLVSKLASRFYMYPSSRVKVVGITGTNGKTTSSYLIEAILSKKGITSGLIGTIDYHFQDKIISAKNTTPGAIDLQFFLNKMVSNKIDCLVLEVSSHALDQHRVDHIDFDIGLFTNLTQEHLDYHQTMERYFEAKANLFDLLSVNASAVINIDDPRGKELVSRTKANVLSYAIDNQADIRAEIKQMSLGGTIFKLESPRGKIDIETGLIGTFNAYNLLGAIGVALAMGIDLRTIKSAIAEFKVVPGRLEAIETSRPIKVFVDYAHTDNALESLLSTLRKFAPARIITVFGCGGERDKSKRPLMGRLAQTFSDYTILTSDNSRRENPAEIIDQIESGMNTAEANYELEMDRYQAIKKAIAWARDNDIVVIAGKGHEAYQAVNGERISFDDRQVTREILSNVYD